MPTPAFDITDREPELEILTAALNSNKPEFLAVYGRRRVGKTHLIHYFFSKQKNIIYFNATGTQDGSIGQQIANFTDRISETFYHGAKLVYNKNWRDTFKLLTDTLSKQPENNPIVLFFDELPWMATKNSKLLQTLEYFWNQYWSKDKRIKLIICGSSASWIIEKIINNKGGLHNRVTHTMLIEPFNLKTTKKFLNRSGIKVNNQQTTELYMVTGGIPFYLMQLKKGLSVAQNIEQLAFKKGAFFASEFDNLFSSLFDNADVYIDIIRCIAKNRYGVPQEEIFSSVKELSKGGQGKKKLFALEAAGFIESFVPHYNRQKGIYYKIVDEFSLFYLRWIEPIKQTLLKKGVAPHYWESEILSPAWKSWAGYTFETICYKHLSQIRKALQINPTAIPNTWRYFPKNKTEDGAQIDFLFDHKDNVITVCEAKYSDKAFVIDKAYAKELERKIQVFQKITGTKKEIFIAMISANGLKPSMYSEEMIKSVVTLNDFFA